MTVWQIPDAVDTVVCAPDDEWWYHPKHVEQFPDKINCVTLHLVRHILEYVSVTFASAHANRTYWTLIKEKRSTSFSKLFDAVLSLAMCWALEGMSFISKGKGSLRQREASVYAKPGGITQSSLPSNSSKTVIRIFLQLPELYRSVKNVDTNFPMFGSWNSFKLR